MKIICRAPPNGNIHLSILMPVYNEERFLEAAVRSILDYSFPSWLTISVIIVNDFSTDSTALIARGLADRWAGQVFVYEGIRKGKNCAFNHAFSFVTTGYVCICAGDDLIVPAVLVKRVSVLVDILIGEPDKGLRIASACKIKTFSDSPEHTGIVIPRNLYQGSLSGGGVMLPFSLASEIFPLPEELPNEDTWIGLYLKHKRIEIVHVPEVGLNYRIHAGNSHKRGVSFAEFRLNMWRRSRAVITFYCKHGQTLSAEDERGLVSDIFIECAKMLSLNLALCFAGNMSLREKLVALTYSSRLVYWVKQRLYRYLTGW